MADCDAVNSYEHDVFATAAVSESDARVVRAYLNQRERIARCFGGSHSWLELLAHYPDLDSTKRAIARVMGITDECAQAGIEQMLREYVASWPQVALDKCVRVPIPPANIDSHCEHSTGMELPFNSSEGA